jgi:hypothetical protein
MEPAARRVFISHSSKSSFATGVCRLVVRQLRAKNYQVFLDADELRPGEEWRSVLNHRLADCHAAVLLLSREALASPWVRREINILLWRRSLGAAVHVIPALIGDVGRDDVAAAGFSELEPFQYARLPGGKSGKSDAALLATAITDRFADLKAEPVMRDPMQKWIDRVTFFLSHVGDDESINDCGRYLGIAEEDLSYLKLPEGRRFLAHQLLNQDLTNSTYSAVRAVSDYLGREWLAKLIQDIAFVWVNMQAARQLLDVYEEPGGGVALLNARSALTAYEYIDRATCRGDYWREMAGTPVGEDAVPELVAHYERAVAAMLGVEPPWTLTDMTPRSGMCVLVVDPAGVRMEVVAQAIRITRERHPWLVIMLMTGDTVAGQDIVTTLGPERVRELVPVLGPRDEPDARRLVKDLRRLCSDVN